MKHQGREIALQILFHGEFTDKITPQDVLNLFEDSFPKEALDYADELVQGVRQHQTEIDKTIQSTSSHWALHRMALVDRNILRVSIFEMKHAIFPVKPNISINEAVELAKKYGSTDSPSFVNGVLDTVARKVPS